jgi:hypothetical protein
VKRITLTLSVQADVMRNRQASFFFILLLVFLGCKLEKISSDYTKHMVLKID